MLLQDAIFQNVLNYQQLSLLLITKHISILNITWTITKGVQSIAFEGSGHYW